MLKKKNRSTVKQETQQLNTFIHEFGLSACEAHTQNARQTALHLTDDRSFSEYI